MRYKMLTRNNEFARAYARGKSYVHKFLVLYVNKNRQKKLRFGLTATKKIGNAVKRNRARRVMRAALYNLNPQINGTNGVDIVLVARGITPHLKSQDVQKAMLALFTKAGITCENGNENAQIVQAATNSKGEQNTKSTTVANKSTADI